jgi:hypothetical protein
MRAKRPIRLLIYLALVGLLLCLLGTGLSAASNIGLPPHSTVADRLSEVEKAHLAEAVHLRQVIGDAVWPGWGTANIPLIVYNESFAFLVGYPDPPPGWIKVPGAIARGGPWEPVPGDTYDGQPYYRQALPAPNVTPQAFVVQVGERWVGSMTTYEWTHIELVNEIRASLPAVLKPIVPYRVVVLPFNSDWHIAALEHESFHAYQGLLSPDRLLAAETANHAVEADYPWDDSGFRQAWQTELASLVKAMQATTPAETARLSREFLKARAARRAEHGLTAALVDFERQREWLEGLAKYAELESWRRGATTAGYEPLPALDLDADFKAYTGFEQRWSSEFTTIRNQASVKGDGRFYYGGWAQAVLLDRLAPGWKAQAFADGVWLEDLLRCAAAP